MSIEIDRGWGGNKRVCLREYSQNVLHMCTKSSRNRFNLMKEKMETASCPPRMCILVRRIR